MLKKVIYARLHTSAFIPGVGELAVTLPPKNKTFDLDMTYGEFEGLEGLHLTVNGVKAVIPPGNVALCVFAPEAAPKPDPKAPVKSK